MTTVTNLSPSEIQNISFLISAKGDELNSVMQSRLGLTERYGPARLAIAYAISISNGKIPKPSSNPSSKRPLKGLFLFGESSDIYCWTVLIKTRFPEADLSTTRGYRILVNNLWETGIMELNQVWESLNGDHKKFITHLAETAGINTSGSASIVSNEPEEKSVTKEYSSKSVKLTIGGVSENAKTREKIDWEINKDGNSPIMTFMGAMNSGKTHTTFQMLEQIKEQSDATFLIIDVKGDLSEKAQRLGAMEINCIDSPVPLDVFTPVQKSENAVKFAAQSFRDTFVQVPKSNMGQLQRTNCLNAAQQVMSKSETVTLKDIKDEVDDIYSSNNHKTDILQATLNELCMFDNFKPEMSVDEFFSKSWSIKIDECTEAQQRLIPFFLIDSLWNWYKKMEDSDKTGNYRALRNVLVVDEARTVLKTSQNSLIEIVRKSRSKGGVAVFMSQHPEDFVSKEEDFLSNVGLAVAFNTKAKSSALKRVLGENVDLGSLEAGHCYTRISNLGSKPVKVKVWEPTQENNH